MAETRRLMDDATDWLAANGIDYTRVPLDAVPTLLPKWVVIDVYRRGPHGGVLVLRGPGPDDVVIGRAKTVVPRTVEPPPTLEHWIAGRLETSDLWMYSDTDIDAVLAYRRANPSRGFRVSAEVIDEVINRG